MNFGRVTFRSLHLPCNLLHLINLLNEYEQLLLTQDQTFSNSLIIHQVYAKELMTLTVFGYLTLINIYFFMILFLRFLLKQFWLRRYIKHLRQCLTTFLNTTTSDKNTLQCVVFSTLLSVFKPLTPRAFCQKRIFTFLRFPGWIWAKLALI